jgi:hypothetical protein
MYGLHPFKQLAANASRSSLSEIVFFVLSNFDVEVPIFDLRLFSGHQLVAT